MPGFNRPTSPPDHPLLTAARKSGLSLHRKQGQIRVSRFGHSIGLRQDPDQSWWLVTDTATDHQLGPYQDPAQLLRAASQALDVQGARSRQRLARGPVDP
ncbi:hypothetical protein [Nocardiopsis nanhaiensis]